MNLQRNGQSAKNCYAGSKSGTSDTSIYSTCSNSNQSSSSSTHRGNLVTSVQSVVLAGQCNSNAKVSDITLGESFFHNEANYSISPLDLNLDVSSEDNDVYTDCQEDDKSDTSKSDRKSDSDKSNNKFNSNKDDSTTYVPYEAMLQNYEANDSKCNNQADQSKFEIEKEKNPNRLVTIVEESEMTRTTNSVFAKTVSSPSYNNTGKYLVDLVDEMNAYNKVSTKRVLFANECNLPENNKKNKNKADHVQKTPKPLAGKNQVCTSTGKGIDENSNNHNTTESFVMWEKYCKASEYLDSRKSCSFSELNTVESYDGDNEFSVTLKSLDDTYLSKCSVDLTEENSISRKSIYRSKSCDDLLREVKHLPHVLYDRFLKCLSTEIENMRKQKVYCTCQRAVRKPQNKQNTGKCTKHNIKNPTLKVTNIENKKENKLLPKTALLNPVAFKTRLSPGKDLYHSYSNSRLSPEITRDISRSKIGISPDVLKESSRLNNVQRLSPRSPNKHTPKQKLCWQKEIISPVGEYIRGKRPSPYRSSPNKRVV